MVDTVTGSASGTEAGGRALEGVLSDETPWGAGEYTIGSEVAGYRLDEQIGRGGMAVVYRAQDPRLERRVALKILAPELARDEGFRQRFIRESRAAAAVDHPHIIPVFGAGESGGVLFIAMRYVEGGDVRTLIDRVGPLPVARAVRIIAQVGSALDAAHAHGLIHRDIKPGNMLLDASDGADHVYLSDFGLSKQALSSTHLTATGQFLGTLDYVAPEQIEGRPMDGRVDLYALGCAAFEMLSGSPPFQREQRLAVLWAQMSEPPPALTARRPDLPPAVDAVLAKALAKSPEDRYPRCVDFVAALRIACGLGSGNGSTGPEMAVTGPGHPATDLGGRPATIPEPLAEPAGSSPAAGAPAHPATEVSELSEPVRAATDLSEPSQPAPETSETSETSQPAPEISEPPRPATEISEPSRAAAETAEPTRPATELSEPARPATEISEPSRPATEISEPSRAAAEAVVRPARRPREVLRPERAAASPAGAAATAQRAVPGGDQATQFGQPVRPGQERPGPGWPQGTPPPPPTGGSRPWWRSPVALIVGCVVVLGLAGGAYAITRGGGGKNGTTSSGSPSPSPSVRTVTLSPPGRSTAVVTASTLPNVRSESVAASGEAYAVVVTANGYSFVSNPSGPQSNIAIFQHGSGLAPTPVGSFAIIGKPHGETITPDGRYLLVADHDGAQVIDIHAAEQGAANPIVGGLSDPGGSNAAQVKVTPDGQFAFVTLYNSNAIAVFNLKAAIAGHFSSSHFLGTIPLHFNPLGMALSPDGQWLYATTGNLTKNSPQGGLNVIDLHKAETHPSAAAITTTVSAGTFPVRIVTTDNGNFVWVTARDSNSLLGFDAARLLNDQKHALVAVVRVGQAPIGLTSLDNGKLIIVADSNINKVTGGTTDLAVVNTADALAGKPAVLGIIGAGVLPHQVAMDGKTLLVANTTSQQLQAVDVSHIPSGH